jgi:UDP-N-acetylglucosamine/UDP-N-acetylgalactosamine diphosphorylase
MDGKVLLETKSRVAVAPDGNSSLYAAITEQQNSNSHGTRRSRITQGLYAHPYRVDNCLVRVADPVFVGYDTNEQADCAVKVVPKAYPTESVGVVAKRDGKYNVMGYSEISNAQAEERDTTREKLLFRASNIANQFYTTALFQGLAAYEEDLLSRPHRTQYILCCNFQARLDILKHRIYCLLLKALA